MYFTVRRVRKSLLSGKREGRSPDDWTTFTLPKGFCGWGGLWSSWGRGSCNSGSWSSSGRWSGSGKGGFRRSWKLNGGRRSRKLNRGRRSCWLNVVRRSRKRVQGSGKTNVSSQTKNLMWIPFTAVTGYSRLAYACSDLLAFSGA